MEQNKNIHQHIMAARGWLNRAEDSLANKNDIQGDLKLMLAQAELQRAQEKNGKKLCVRWFKKLAPGAVACMLALGGIVYVQSADLPVERSPGNASVTKNVSEMKQADEKHIIAKESSYDAVKEAELAGTADGHERLPAAGSEAVTVSHTEVLQYEPAKKDTQQSTHALENMNKAEVPAPDMQKLMQSAGSVLRE